MAFVIILLIALFFSWRFIVTVVNGAIQFSIFVIRNVQIILPLMIFSWVWYRFGLLVAISVTLVILIGVYIFVLKIIESNSNSIAPHPVTIQPENRNKLISPVKAVKPRDV